MHFSDILLISMADLADFASSIIANLIEETQHSWIFILSITETLDNSVLHILFSHFVTFVHFTYWTFCRTTPYNTTHVRTYIICLTKIKCSLWEPLYSLRYLYTTFKINMLWHECTRFCFFVEYFQIYFSSHSSETIMLSECLN